MSTRERRGPVSPLLRRILAVNVLAVGILGGGILYLADFREKLIEGRVDTLVTQAEIIAGAIGETATGGPEATGFELAAAQQIITRLIGPTETRARLFGTDGALMADSRVLTAERQVLEVPLPPLERRSGVQERVVREVNRALDFVIRRPVYPPYTERPNQMAADYAETAMALTGEPDQMVRTGPRGASIISVAVPVQRFRRVLGALMLSADTSDIETLVREEQITILKVFGIAFLLTLLLSVFLARTIVRPVGRLASAADRVRKTIGRAEELPQMLNRRDEIGDLARSLSEMTRALYRQIDAMESFAADVSHEIKNPLTSVRSAVETMKRSEDPEVQQKLMDVIEDDIKRIDRLITDISDASRLDAELSRGRMAQLDFADLVKTLVEIHDASEAEGRTKLTLTLEDDVPLLVAGVESRLAQVVRNLISNAISFSPTGATVEVILNAEDARLNLLVEDEGPGLPEGFEDKIFQRFYSERPSDEAFGTHSGLGLSISKQIVEAHDGTLTAENRVEISDEDEARVVGARFRVTLPRAD